MPRGKRTSIPEAARAKALADIGYQATQIADATGLPTRTVDDIINGRNGWREIIANDQAFKQYRTDAKRKMQAASIKLSQKALQQIENRIDKASAPQAAMVYGILRDKERLDAGEPTEITAVYSHAQIQGLDKLSQLLSQTLLPSGKMIDVTPAESGTTESEN
jgi:Ribonuclease G/E